MKKIKPLNYRIAILLLFVGFAGAFMVFAQPHRIFGNCMEPAIRDGKLYFLNKSSGYLTPHHIGDVILFKHEGKVWVSRIVALENNTLEINENTIKIDDSELHDHVNRDWTSWRHGIHAINTPFLVPVNHVYVLSDNLSAHHDDSRIFGAIPYSEILGKLW